MIGGICVVSYKLLCSAYPLIAKFVPYSDLCRWEDWLRSNDAPSDLLQLVVLARGWSHHCSRVPHGDGD